MNKALIDTHTHLYVDSFEKDLEAVMERAKGNGVERFYLPAIDSDTHDAMMAVETKFHGSCFAMMGLHPCSVKEDYRHELEVVRGWLDKRSFVAIGEIGLDYYWDTSFKEQQLEAFETQIGWALERDIPIVIHSRNAMEDTIEVVQEYAAKGLRGIFHCFSGNEEQARQVVETGFYLGIGGVLTYKKSGLAEAIVNIPIEKLVLETDSPYLSPVPFRGKRNESSYLVHIAEKLAEVKGISVDEVAEITSRNAKNIFGN